MRGGLELARERHSNRHREGGDCGAQGRLGGCLSPPHSESGRRSPRRGTPRCQLWPGAASGLAGRVGASSPSATSSQGAAILGVEAAVVRFDHAVSKHIRSSAMSFVINQTDMASRSYVPVATEDGVASPRDRADVAVRDVY